MLPIPPIPAVLFERRDWTVPSPEWEQWARSTFIDSASKLCDPGLAHLEGAIVGFLLTNAAIKIKGELKAGLGGVCKPSGETHTKAQREQQLKEWFGLVPDFLITLSVSQFGSTRHVCSLVNHELRHCGVETDQNGAKFGQDGRPVWTTVPHFAELVDDELARWGPQSVPGGVQIAREISAPPLIRDEDLTFDG